MRIWEAITETWLAVTRPNAKTSPGNSLFVAWCVLILACYLILLAGSLSSFPQGGSGDFLVSYTAAKILRECNGERLYDLGFQTAVQENILASYGSGLSQGPLPYLHPPFFAAIFIPLTFFSARTACYIWICLSTAILFTSILLLYRARRADFKRDFPSLLLMALAYYPVFETLRKGQSSFLLLLLITACYLGLRRGASLAAGVALGLALMKPQIACVLAAVLLYKRRWRPLVAFATTATALVAGSWLLVGTGGLKAYVRLTEEAVAWEGIHHVYPQAMPNLRGTIKRIAQLAVGAGGADSWVFTAAMIAASAAVVMFMIRTWKGPWTTTSVQFDLRFSQTVLGSILLSPYLYWHDLSLLVLAGILSLSYLDTTREPGSGYLLLAVGHLCAIPLSLYVLGTDLSAPIMGVFLAGTMVFLMERAKREPV